MQTMIEILKMTWLYVVEIGASFLCFSLFFFAYARYKTGKEFKALLHMYFDVIAKSGLFTAIVLGAVFVLIQYVPMFHIVIFLLSISSISILLKYVFAHLNKKAMIFDTTIILANAYCSYVLIMQEKLTVHHNLLLGGVIFCFFLYQQIKKIS